MQGISKNKMAAKMVMPTSVSFLEMPSEILCCLSIPTNTLRRVLEFCFLNNNSYSKNVGSSSLKNKKKQLIFKKEVVNNHGFLVVYYYVFYLLGD
jgi:hypothetical protein